MSQKPRTAAPGRPAYTAKVGTKPALAKAEPEVKVEAAPVAVVEDPAPVMIEEPAPVAVETIATVEAAELIEAPAAEAAAPVPEMPVDADPVPPAATEAVQAAETITPTLSTPVPIQGLKTMMKSTEDFVAFGQANIEAFVKSGQIWSAGMQELTKQFATTAKASFDESVSTFKALSTVKSVKEALEMQSTFAKASMEKAIAESNKLTDASIKLTEQALAPITARVTTAVETFSKAA